MRPRPAAQIEERAFGQVIDLGQKIEARPEPFVGELKVLLRIPSHNHHSINRPAFRRSNRFASARGGDEEGSIMTSWTSWTATAAAGLSLMLVIVNAVLVSNNQSNQLAVTQRQQFINQGADLVRIEQAMVRSAIAANNPKDDAFTKLMGRYNIKPTAAASAPTGGK